VRVKSVPESSSRITDREQKARKKVRNVKPVLQTVRVVHEQNTLIVVRTHAADERTVQLLRQCLLFSKQNEKFALSKFEENKSMAN